MMDSELDILIDTTFAGLDKEKLPAEVGFTRGKVRDVISFKDSLLIVTSDRISAFDRVLSTIPCKGEVLHGLSSYWFDSTKGIIQNHFLKEISPRAMLVRPVKILPVEVVVRGYLTGSAYRDYKSGKSVSGIKLSEGLKKNEKLPEPIITPSTKAEAGMHDLPVSREEILQSRLVEKSLWERVEKAALELFDFASKILLERNLILVDTKYEFGLADGELLLADEIHTPDSSRFWYLDTYKDLFERGEEPRQIDKEYLRKWLMDKGFMGDGEAPSIPREVRVQVAQRYIEAYENITNKKFLSKADSSQAEQQKLLSYITEHCNRSKEVNKDSKWKEQGR